MPLSFSADANALSLFLFLLLAGTIDLMFRWLAFGRVESVAIDIAIFSTLYSAVEMLKETVFKTTNPAGSWGLRVVFGLVVLLLLSALHSYMRQQLSKQLEIAFNKLHDQIVSTEAKNFVNAQHTIAAYAIEVALVSWKPGKQQRRVEICESLKSVKPDVQDVLRETDFLLPALVRRSMMGAFFLLGGVSIVIPWVNISSSGVH